MESPAAKRHWEIDVLRGLMLVLMTLTHLPTRLTDPLGQPFGFVSAAEGFVLLSAFMAGLVYSRIGHGQGLSAMRRGFWRQALKIYMSQAATLLFLFTFITALGLRIDQPALRDLLSYYLTDPHHAFLYSMLLVYEPPLLDILPMYVFFMLLSPWVLSHALRRGWTLVIATSIGVWVLAQFGLSEWLYQRAVQHLGLPVPFRELGAFNALAWQLLWFIGLWIGASRSAPDAKPLRFANWLLAVSAAAVLYGIYWRHYGPNGQAPFGGDSDLNLLFDKWQLGPLRLINLAALSILVLRFGPWLLARLPRPRWLEAMGTASLPVFCAHLAAVLLVLAIFGDSHTVRPWWGDALLLTVVFAALYGVARAVLWRTKRAPAGVGSAARKWKLS